MHTGRDEIYFEKWESRERCFVLWKIPADKTVVIMNQSTKSRQACQTLSDNVVREMTNVSISYSDRLHDKEKANRGTIVNIIWKRDRCAKAFEF